MEAELEYLLDSGNTLRFRNNGTKFFRKMGICILKYFFRFVSVLKLVYYLFCFCLCIFLLVNKTKFVKVLKIYTDRDLSKQF